MKPLQDRTVRACAESLLALYAEGFTNYTQITTHQSVREYRRHIITGAYKLLRFEGMLIYKFDAKAMALSKRGAAHVNAHGPILYPKEIKNAA